MIKTDVLARLTQQLIAVNSASLGVNYEALRMTMRTFFATDPEIVGTENEGKHDSYYEAIRDIAFELAEAVDDIWEETDPEHYTRMF